jgi:antimicrobial peptide system SdpA family protein
MTRDSKPEAGARGLGLLALGLFVFAATFVVYAVHGSMPTNALSLPGESQLHTVAWVPEGWKFFTRDPQAETMLPFVREDGDWRLATPTGGDARYLFGWDRSGRGIWIEIALLVEGAPASMYVACEDEPQTCIARSDAQPIVVRNRSPKKYLCGDVAIVAQKPVPWAWARDGHPPVMPSRFLKMRVEC